MDFQGGSPIGRNVARYRKAAGLSAAELADATGNGLTRSVIANLENDRKDDITVKQLMAISRTLSVPPVALLADLFDPGALSAYPVPSAGETRNAELIQWVGGHTAQPVEPEKAPAGKLAADALGAVRRYFTAVQWFRSSVTRYAAVREAESLEASEEKDFQEQQLQYAAESVFGAIEAMQAIGVNVEPYVPAEVHKKLASVGKTYEPIVNDDPFRDFPPPPAPF